MVLTFSPESKTAINGILKHFRDQKLLDGYVHTFSTPTRTPLSKYNSSHILNITNDNFWASEKTEEEKYVGITFRDHYVVIKSYTIKQYSGTDNLIENWKLQGLKGTKWIDIDDQSSEDFCVPEIIPTFSVARSNNFYQSIRIYNVGKSCKETDLMRIAGIELFGTVCKGNPALREI